MSGRLRWIVLAGSLLLCGTARADLRRPAAVMDLTAVPPGIAPIAPAPDGAITIVGIGPRTPLAVIIAQAAFRTGVPESFLLRLLRQESGLNPQAVSPKGALGIAQFMPGTAVERGLDDPFDPEKAIPKAAELLRDLRNRYGNWGLAAAAYNAGPGRIDAWLIGRSELPRETAAYVASITGSDATAWQSMPGLAGFMRRSFASAEAELAFSIAGRDDIPPQSKPPKAFVSAPVAAIAILSGGSLPRQASPKAGRTFQIPSPKTDRSGPCAALLDQASQCLAFNRY